MILRVRGPPGCLLAASWKEVPKILQKVKFASPFREAICCPFWRPIRFSCILFVSILILVLGIALGRPPFAVLKIWGLFQGVFWDHFGHLFADAAKIKQCICFKRHAWFGGSWASVFISFYNVFQFLFLCCNQNRIFCDLSRLWLPNVFCFAMSIFAGFACAYKKVC